MSESSAENTLRIHDQFWKMIDPSWLTKIADLLQLSDFPLHLSGPWYRARLMGEGRGFRVYSVERPSDRIPKLVIKLPSTQFIASHSPGSQRKWRDWVEMLGRSRLPYIPPMTTINWKDAFLLTMPYGELDPNHQSLTKHRDASTSVIDELKKHGLTLNDSPQWLQHEGLNFVCDFSDLKKI